MDSTSDLDDKYELYKASKVMGRKVVETLGPILNEINHCDFDSRQWELLLGHWATRVATTFLRIARSSKEQDFELNDLDVRTVIKKQIIDCIPLNSHEAIFKLDDSVTHYFLRNQLIAPFARDPFPQSNLSDQQPQPVGNFKKIVKSKPNFKSGLAVYLNYASIRLAPKTAPVIYNSYLPWRTELALNLLYGRLPLIPIAPRTASNSSVNLAQRNALALKLSEAEGNKLEKTLFSSIPLLLPLSYLELMNFHGVSNEFTKSEATPKFIFTSNNFDTDEAFKFFAAQQVGKGTPYFVGQHGNNYGMSKYSEDSIEEITADKFLTWGWGESQVKSKYVAMFNLKVPSERTSKIRKINSIVLILDGKRHFSESYDSREWIHTLDATNVFLGNLSKPALDQLSIKFHPGSSEAEKREYQNHKWTRQKLKISQKPMRSLLASSSLLVFNYDSTGLLEALTLNHPCVSFFPNGNAHLNSFALEGLKNLSDVGIIFSSALDCASFLSSLNGNYSEWWMSSSVQAARKEYIDRYCRSNQKPAIFLKSKIDSLFQDELRNK